MAIWVILKALTNYVFLFTTAPENTVMGQLGTIHYVILLWGLPGLINLFSKPNWIMSRMCSHQTVFLCSWKSWDFQVFPQEYSDFHLWVLLVIKRRPPQRNESMIILAASQDGAHFHSLTFSSFPKGFLACHSIRGRDTQYRSGSDTSPMTHWRGWVRKGVCVSVCVPVCVCDKERDRKRCGSSQQSLKS